MRPDDQLIRKMFTGILITNIISIVAGIGCTMIDSIVTGQFLGTDAITASGMITPVVMIINLVGGLIGGGLGVVCSHYMGKAQRDKVNQIFSLTLVISIVVLTVMAVVIFVAAPQIAVALGGKTNSEVIVKMIRNYLRGYSFGVLPMRITILLSGVMMLDNDKKRSMMAMGATLVSDLIFDLANALLFHKGMLGMAIATTLSNVVGFLVIMTHYLRKNRVIHFTTKGWNLWDMKDVVLRGLPAAISMGCEAIKIATFNAFLLNRVGKDAVASLSVANSAFSVINAVGVGIMLSSSMLCSMLYGEEDRLGLENAVYTALRYTATGTGILGVLVVAFPKVVASLFVRPQAAGIMIQGASFIRCMGVQFLLMGISFALSGIYQATGLIHLNYIMDAMRLGVFPLLSVLALGMSMGVDGMEAGFILAGFLTLALCIFIPFKYNKKLPRRLEDFLILKEDFGAGPDECFETSMKNMDDVMETSEQVMKFCSDKGADRRTAFMFSLFVEEMAANIVNHGFAKGKGGSIDLRLIYRDDSKMIRFRDDSLPFDPVSWLEKNSTADPSRGMGIRMVVKLAKSVTHMNSMEMNNLIIQI